MSAHPSQIDLADMHARVASGSGRLPVSATLLVCLPAIIPTLWMGVVVTIAIMVRF